MFIVGEDDGKIIGFCMGYLCEKNDFMKHFLHHNYFRIGLRCFKLFLTGNKLMYKKIKKYFNKADQFKTVNPEIDTVLSDKKGDLLSICALPEYRGSGFAKSLIEEYEKRIREKGCIVCQLTVDPKNSRAVHFYKKMDIRNINKLIQLLHMQSVFKRV